MSTYVNSCCNNRSVQSGMFIGPYLPTDLSLVYKIPRVKTYSGWDNYKNAKTGQYNRQVCGYCAKFKGFPQTPGVYNTRLADAYANDELEMYKREMANCRYAEYQKRRMEIYPGDVNGDYNNYFNTTCNYLYPQKYVKGNWPDEKLIYTNIPK